MNHYAQALAELQLQPDHELKQIGDQWQTPKALAWGLFHQFAPTLGPVVLDMFADDCNALVPNYYDAEDNALTQELAVDLRRLGGAAFGNPPYSRPCCDTDGNPITGMEPILAYCREQREAGAKIMLLIKAATSETWWPEDADFIQFISGRIGFELPQWYKPRDPKKDKPTASGFASAVVIFDASWHGERRPEARLRRDDLITTGKIILEMINRQAVALNEAASQTITKTTAKAPAVMQDQPAVAEPAAWEPPVASDDATNAAAASELAELEYQPQPSNTEPSEEAAAPAQIEQVASHQGDEPVIGGLHPDYADPELIMGKQLECIELSDKQKDKVTDHVSGWIEEGYPLSEIYYRLDLAVSNLLAGKPIHDGFVPEGRSPSLPHWQRHSAVKSVIYQLDQADILSPKMVEALAGEVINAIGQGISGDTLLTMASDICNQLLGVVPCPVCGRTHTLGTAEATAISTHGHCPYCTSNNHSEQQLELLDGPEQEPDTHQQADEPSTKPLEAWADDYQNNQLNLGGATWPTFVAVLTVLYGIKECYSAREVAIAISVSDEQLMDEYTTLDEETKALLRKAVSMLRQIEGFNITETCPVFDPHRQAAVSALLLALEKDPDLSPIKQSSVMINTLTRMYEVVT